MLSADAQVLLVVDPSIHNLPYPCTQQECPDGVTPPMRKARARHFQPPINIPEPMMKDAVTDVLEMLAGRWDMRRAVPVLVSNHNKMKNKNESDYKK